MMVFESWQSFVRRPDNKGLTTEQMRNKYLYEQFMYEQFIMERTTSTSTSDASSGGAAGGGVLPPIDPSTNLYVVDDYIDDYFI